MPPSSVTPVRESMRIISPFWLRSSMKYSKYVPPPHSVKNSDQFISVTARLSHGCKTLSKRHRGVQQEGTRVNRERYWAPARAGSRRSEACVRYNRRVARTLPAVYPRSCRLFPARDAPLLCILL